MSQIFSPNTTKVWARTGSLNDATVDTVRFNNNNNINNKDEDASATVNEMLSDDDEISRSSSAESDSRERRAKRAVAQVMVRSQWKINTSIQSKRAEYDKICSICLRDSSENNTTTRTSSSSSMSSSYGNAHNNPLITPCLCAGIRSHQHKRCIEQWIEQTGSVSCPFCFVRYEYTRERKSFWSYMNDSELEHDFLVSSAAIVLSLYLFLVGASVCYHHTFLVCEYDTNVGNMATFDKHPTRSPSSWLSALLSMKMLTTIRAWLAASFDVNEVLECHHNSSQINDIHNNNNNIKTISHIHSWLTSVMYCFVCIATVLLFIAIVSMSISLVFRHYVRYWLWCQTHFEVSIKEYSLSGLGLEAAAAAASVATTKTTTDGTSGRVGAH